MKYAVLGATGLLGHHAARAIRAAGHDLVLIHRPSSQIQRLAYLEPECRVAEMLDHAGLERALRGLDGVIFSAGYYPSRPRRWQEEVASALGQTNPFYAACLQARVPRILYVGSAYAMPRHPQGLPGHEGLFYDSLPSGKSSYVLCKWALDEQAREQARNGLPVVIGIPGMVLGELDIGPTTGRVITAIGNGEMTHYVAGQRNVIDAAEAGRGLLMALERGRIGERYLLTGHNLEMADLTRRIAELLGQPAPQPMSMAMARALATLGRLRYRVSGQLPLLDETAIEVMAGGQFLDGRKAREELGFFSTTALDDTLLRAIDWFRDNGYFNAQDGWLGQRFFREGSGLQSQLGAKALHVEHGAQLLQLALRVEHPEAHRGNAQHLVAGRIAQGRPDDGADQRAPGEHLAFLADAVFDHDLQVRHRRADVLQQADIAGGIQGTADERAFVEEILAVQLLHQRHAALVPGQLDVMAGESFQVV